MKEKAFAARSGPRPHPLQPNRTPHAYKHVSYRHASGTEASCRTGPTPEWTSVRGYGREHVFPHTGDVHHTCFTGFRKRRGLHRRSRFRVSFYAGSPKTAATRRHSVCALRPESSACCSLMNFKSSSQRFYLVFSRSRLSTSLSGSAGS